MNIFESVISYSQVFWPVKVIFLWISFVFVFYILYSIWQTRWFKFVFGYAWVEFFTLRPYGLGKAARQWHQVRRQFIHPRRKPNYRQSLIQAEAILDDFLDDIVIFFQTISLEQRLNHLEVATISNIESLKLSVQFTEALKTDQTGILEEKEALEHLEVYHRAFVDLGIAKD